MPSCSHVGTRTTRCRSEWAYTHHPGTAGQQPAPRRQGNPCQHRPVTTRPVRASVHSEAPDLKQIKRRVEKRVYAEGVVYICVINQDACGFNVRLEEHHSAPALATVGPASLLRCSRTDTPSLPCGASRRSGGHCGSGFLRTPPLYDYYVFWSSVPAATYYELQEGSVSGFNVVYSGALTNYITSGRGTRTYSVRACSAAGCSDWKGTLTLP